MNMEPKFKVGQKVIVVDAGGNTDLREGSVLIVSAAEMAWSDRLIYRFKWHNAGAIGLFEYRLAAIDDGGWVTWEGGESWPQWLDEETKVEIKMRDGGTETCVARCFSWSHDGYGGDIVAYRTEHTKNSMNNLKKKELMEFDGGRAPILWNAMKDRLTPEELENLKQVILDEDMYVINEQGLCMAFHWDCTKQGAKYWRDIYDRIFYKELRAEQAVVEDNGSAATSKHYNSKFIQPIEICQMVLTSEEFKGAMKFNIMKYTQRAGSKEGEASEKDWNKAKQYKLWLELAEQGVTINPREHVV